MQLYEIFVTDFVFLALAPSGSLPKSVASKQNAASNGTTKLELLF